MAGLAERHKVRKVISFGMTFQTENAKRGDVVNVQRSPAIGARLAAVLTYLVPLARLALRASPRWAVVGFIAALPMRVALAAKSEGEQGAEAQPRTAFAAGSVAGFCQKVFAADFALLVDGLPGVRRAAELLALVRVRVAPHILRLPRAEALKRTEAPARARRRGFKAYAALLAGCSESARREVIPQVRSVSPTRTHVRTVFARPTSKIFELNLASWAVCGGVLRQVLASFGWHKSEYTPNREQLATLIF